MTEFPGPEGPIREVATGMTVIDAAGDVVGTVDEVRLADRGTVTAAGQSPPVPGRGPLAWLAEIFGPANDMDQQAQERLVRLGFVRVDTADVFAGRRYVEADEIASVAGDEVRLSVTADKLLR